MQPPPDKQRVKVMLQNGLWLTGQYLKRNTLLNGEPGYTVEVGRNSVGAYYEDRVVEWQPIDDVDAGQLSLFGEAA